MPQIGIIAERNADGTFGETRPILREKIKPSPAFEKAVEAVYEMLYQKALAHAEEEARRQKRHKEFEKLVAAQRKRVEEQEGKQCQKKEKYELKHAVSR